jgi:GT2 family glycosyltransferase/Flp pilus assembly protein TadD
VEDDDMVRFSFLIPTRGNVAGLRRLFQSIVDTTDRLEELEIILAIDEDDAESHACLDDRLRIDRVPVQKGTTMGALNNACFGASSGRYVMLMNDDVVLRTRGWDAVVTAVFEAYPDEIAFVHVNDLLFREKLCTFPILSRKACDAIGLCPTEYRRYRIDDDIYDIYSLLAYLGYPRMVYLPEVVFEHENFVTGAAPTQGQTFTSIDNKVYVPKPEIMELDAAFFERRFGQRQEAAASLAGLIEAERHARGKKRRERTHRTTLRSLTDSHSYRRPEFVRTLAVGEAMTPPLPRTTIAVVTADIRNEVTRQCLARIKAHTSNYDLVILDNARKTDFSHPREMNKVLRNTDTPYVVLMDDDVLVEAGWLEGLHAAMDAETGVVTPLHQDKTGTLSFSGLYLTGDGRGTHAHTLDRPERPRVMQGYCSAILLIDTRKCGHLFMDEAYAKYFFDLVHGFEVWESGFKAICTPAVTVTHIGGATMRWGSEESNALLERDRAVFIREWIESGRLARLENGIWRKDSYLKGLCELARQVTGLAEILRSVPSGRLRTQLDELHTALRPYTLLEGRFRQIVHELLATLGSSETLPQAETCLAWALGAWNPAEELAFVVALGDRLLEARAFEQASVVLRALRYVHATQPEYPQVGELIAQLEAALREMGVEVGALSVPADETRKAGRARSGDEYLVSALVTVYKAERFMRRLLEDLEAQTIADRLEIVIVDSASPENERKIVEEFQRSYDNIVYLRTDERENSHAALNRAIRMARGRFLTLANADDRHRRDAFERMVEVLESQPGTALVYADSAITDQENQTLESARSIGHLRLPAFDHRRLFRGCCVGPQPMWRRELHDQYGFFDPEFEICGDYEFWLRTGVRETFHHIPDVLGLYFMSPTSNERVNRIQRHQETERARRRHWPAQWGELPAWDADYNVMDHTHAKAPLGQTPSPNAGSCSASVGRLDGLEAGQDALEQCAWAEACNGFIRALEQDPACGVARSGVGLALMALGDAEEGLAQLQESVRLSPTPDAVCNLACGLIHVGRHAEARQLLEGILAVMPTHDAARANLDALSGVAEDSAPSASCSESPAAQLSEMLESAAGHLTNKRWSEAVAEFRAVLRHAPDLAEARAALGSALLVGGRTEEAIPELRAAADALDTSHAWNDLGWACTVAGQMDDGRAAFVKAIERDPANLEPQRNLAALFETLHMPQEAAAAYELILLTAPGDPEAAKGTLRCTDAVATSRPVMGVPREMAVAHG